MYDNLMITVTEHDDVISMAAVSKSTVSVVDCPVAAGVETPMEPLECDYDGIEGSFCGEDGGDIMVEVVGTEVFVDGVGGEGFWNGEEVLIREVEFVHGEGGATCGLASQEVGVLGGKVWEGRIETQGEVLEEITSSSEGVSLKVNEEGVERGEQLVGRGGDATVDEAQNSEVEAVLRASLLISGSPSEQTGVGKGVAVRISKESLERGLVEVVAEKSMVSVKGGSGSVYELPSQGVCSMQTPLCAEEVATVVNEILNHKDEALCSGGEEGNLICSENNQSSVAETVFVGSDKDGAIHSNAKCLRRVEVDVGGDVWLLNEEEIIHPIDDLCYTPEDQQMKVETLAENTLNQVKLDADFIFFSESAVAFTGTEDTTMDDKVSLNGSEVSLIDSFFSNSDVQIPATDDIQRSAACSDVNLNMCCEITCDTALEDDHVLADPYSSNEQAYVTENDVVHRELESSGEKTQIADGSNIVATAMDVKDQTVMEDEEKVSTSEIEVLVADTCFQQDEELGTVTVNGSMEKDSTGQGKNEASGEEIEVGNRVESSVTYCRGIGQVPACCIFEENMSRSEKAEEFSVGKQETKTQLAATHTYEVDGVQSRNMLISGQTTAHGVDLAFSKIVVEGDTDSSASDFMGTFPDEHQVLEFHMASSDICLRNGNQTIVTCVSDAVDSDESYESDEQVPEGQVFNMSMSGCLVVDLDICFHENGKWKPQHESYDSGFLRDDVQAMEGNVAPQLSGYLDGSETSELCLDGSTEGQELDLYGEEVKEMGEGSSHCETQRLVEDKSTKQATLKPRSFAKVHQANYLLPQDNEGKFCVSDLVWGKVRSHPWWPGQIFDSTNASEKAMKYHKRDCFLVAYFGDQTFAWNEASLLKPFWTNFSLGEKQSYSEVFQNAVSCALEEISRRTELGLACSCIPRDAYDKIESQVVENAGIHQESSRRRGVDKYTDVSWFNPEKLVKYIRALAQSPSTEADRLELVVAKAQLSCLDRLKGYCRLPEVQFCGELAEENAGSPQLGEEVFSSKGRLEFGSKSSCGRKHSPMESVYPWKKERRISDIMGGVPSSSNNEDASDQKASSKSVLSSSGKKKKCIDVISVGPEVQDRRISIYAAKVSTASKIRKWSSEVRECISRVPSRLAGSTSVLKCSSGRFQEVDGSSDKTPEADVSLDEVVSQVHLVARDPLKGGYSFLNNTITFLCGFRNSISLDPYSEREASSMGKLGRSRKRKATNATFGCRDEFEFEDANDSYWTDRIIQHNSADQPLGGTQKKVKYQRVTFDSDKSLKLSRGSNSRKQFSNGKHKMAQEERMGYAGERKRDNSPTELILNFSKGHSIPSEMDLNRKFRRFGPLKESETEVDMETSHARVVFKRCSDAEVAFSSARKFKIFGSLIVNYQLSYPPSISSKTLRPLTSQDLEDAN